MTTRTRRPSGRWALLLSAVLALTMLFGALSAISPPTASADTVTLQCGDDQFSGTYGPDSECADLAAYYASEGCTTSSDDAQSGGLDDLFVTCPGPVPPRPDDPNNPGDPDDPDDRPFVCDRAPQDPTWVYGSGAAGEQWRFVLGTGNNAGAIVVTLDNGTFTTDGGYGGFRETNSATGAERLVITSGTGIDAGTGNCLHLEYTPGTTGASQVSGTQTRYGNYIANSSITIAGERVYDCGEVGLINGQQVTTVVDAAEGLGLPQESLDQLAADPCLLTRGRWAPIPGSSEDVFAEGAGTAVLPGRTVQNKYIYEVPLNLPGSVDNPCGFAYLECLDGIPSTADNYVIVGYAILEKTWYWTGGRVTNSAGEDPDKAKLTGAATTLGLGLGYSWLGAAPGSDVDAFRPFNGNGKGAHLSQRNAVLQWEVPLVGSFIAIKPRLNQELSVKGFSDGTVRCTGGTNCLAVPTP